MGKSACKKTWEYAIVMAQGIRFRAKDLIILYVETDREPFLITDCKTDY